MINILKSYPVAHVGYIVENLEAAVSRLSDIYGLEGWIYCDYRPLRAWTRGVLTADYFLRIATSAPSDQCRFEVVEPVSEGVHMDFLRKGQPINHICHMTDHYEALRCHYLDNGCDLIFEAEMEDELRGYRRSCYMYDKSLNCIFEAAEIPHFRNRTDKNK